MDGLIRLSKEIQSIDATLKEYAEAELAVERTYRLRLKVSRDEAFRAKLGVKMDVAVQKQMEKLDKKREELGQIVRGLMLMSAEAPTAHNFDQDSQTVTVFCSELKTYLDSDRSGQCPRISFSTEQAIQRISSIPLSS